MNIFLVEDSTSIRRLLVRRLEAMPGMRVVGEAAGQQQAFGLIRWTSPDVVLMDLSLASGSGLSLVRELRQSGYAGRIAVLTCEDYDAYRRACLDAGADAFYDKASGLETLFGDLLELLPEADAAEEEKPVAVLRDGLTGLYGASALCERLGEAARAATYDGVDLAVYVLRLAGLAELPADISDALALQVADRLREASGEADIVARSATDQFAFVLAHLDQAGQAAAHAQHLGALMTRPFHTAGREYTLALALGMAVFPADAVSPRGLLTLAEATAFGAL
ncbi:response regulator [Roseateles sp.]|uniref:response regulator n=1 Tax=Roseateles sp. TaxID=1971397 RepID=UPI0039E75836